ncbi:MAG: hypothetical protein ACYCW6_26860, partial [Candidatus Xenobia bacterium]
IERLLTGPSVKLPTTHTPLAARGLLTPAEITQSVTPERLLGAMTDAFETARQMVVQVSEAWDQFGTRLADALQEAPELRAELQDLQARMDSDPLGCLETFEPLMDQVRQAHRAREAVRLDIATCRQVWQELTALHDRAEMASSRCQDVIDQVPSMPRKEAWLLPGLQQRLDNMESHLADGSWTPGQIAKGLEAWHTQSAVFRDAEQKAAETWEALLAEREELRGLLAAYKHRAEKRGIVEDAVLIQVGNEAEQQLHAPCKTPLKQARALVDRYRQRIAELTGG